VTEKSFINGLSNSSSDIIQKLLSLLESYGINYCLIGGLAVNAYVEPVVASDQIVKIREVSQKNFNVEKYPYSINLHAEDSDLRIQIQKDPRYQRFVKGGTIKKVLGYHMKVASLEDVLQRKVWAYSDKDSRKSKRQKDLADISRMIESYPHLIEKLPDNIKNLIA